MSNSDMEELVHMLRLLKTNPSGLPRDLKKEYQNALIEYFGTENINDIVDKLNKDGKSAEAVFIREFLEKGPSGEPDERKILEYILAEGVYPENQTDDEVKEVLHMLVEKLGSYKGNLPNKEARKEAAEAAKKAEKAEKEATAERQKMVDAFLKRMSQDTEKKSPVVIAVQRLLMEKKVTEEGLKTLEIYLKGGKRLDDLEADEIDEFIAGRSVQELKKVLKATENQTENLEDELADAESKTQKKDRREVEKMRTLKQDMNRLRKEYALFEVMADDDRARLNDAKRNRYLAIGAQLAAMEKEYNELNEADTDPNIILLKRKIRGLKKQKTYLEAGIKRLEGKKTEETQYYVDKPEKLLGNILTYYAEQKMKEEGKKGTPNYDDILKELHKRITEANESQAGWCRKIVMYASPHSYLKPTLKGTLMAVVGKDDALTKVKPEYAAELAKKWRSPRDVRNWISKLEGVQEAEAMKTIVPALIGHLSAAVNIGGNTYLNTFSIVQAKGLLHNLRQAAHQYSMEQAETKTGTGVEKMNAYFGQLNQIHRNADDVKKSTVSQNMYKVLARNAFIVGGMAAGGWQIAPLLGPAAAAIGSIGIPASTLGVAAAPVGLTLAGSFGIKTPAIREFMQRNAVRTLAVGGLGALAFGATPLLAGGLIAGGLFAPNIWRNRGAIASAAGKATTVAAPVVGKAGVKVGKGVGYVAARGASVGAGVFAAGLLGGLPLLSSKYRKFIGLNAGRWDPLNSGPQSAPSPRPTLSPQPA